MLTLSLPGPHQCRPVDLAHRCVRHRRDLPQFLRRRRRAEHPFQPAPHLVQTQTGRRHRHYPRPPAIIGHREQHHGARPELGIAHPLGRAEVDVLPARDHDVIDPSEHLQPAVGPAATVLGANQIAGQHLRGQVGTQPVPGEGHRPAEVDPFGVELDPDAGQRHSVVDAPTAGLAHAVGGDDRDAGGFGPCPKGRREGAATDQHRGLLAQPGARVGLREGAVELGGDQGDVAPAVGTGQVGQVGTHETDRSTGHHRACHRHQSGDVPGGQRTHPRAGTAEPVVGGVGGEPDRRPRQDHGLRRAGRSGGRDHGGGVRLGDRFVGPEGGEQPGFGTWRHRRTPGECFGQPAHEFVVGEQPKSHEPHPSQTDRRWSQRCVSTSEQSGGAWPAPALIV